MWMTAADKRVEYAEDIYSIKEKGAGAIELLCPTKRIRSRGDTLNCPTLTIKLQAELENVISLEIAHWTGTVRREPNFDLFPAGKPTVSPTISKSEFGTILTSGNLSAVVGPDPHDFSIKFQDGETGRAITALLNRSVGFAYNPPPGNQMSTEDMNDFKHYVFTQTEIGIGESVHGLGERFGQFNKLGQSLQIWNADGGTSSDQAYKNVPFWLSSKGYGVFIDTPELIDLEMGSERCCRVQTSVQAQRLKWFLIYGPNPKDVLTRYSVITGNAPRLPAWSYGLWLTTSFTTDYDEKTVTHFLEQMKDRSIPLEVFHYDCFWMKAFQWCDFSFSGDHFPNPKQSIDNLKQAGLLKKVCVWINPYLGQASPVFAEAAKKGYLLKRTNGDVWQWDLWQAGMGLIDITNPEAVVWYKECLKKLFDVGVDCLKTDFGERIPTQNVKWHNSTLDPGRMHNFYAFIYNKLVFETLQERYGDDQAVLFARTATAGTQRFPLCWGGDCESTAAALAESVRGGLSIGLSGFSYWSCDIGGFEGYPAPWIYKRWVAFGLLCSHSRLHGSNSYRVPWLIDNDDPSPEGATAVLRTFVQVKRRLLPYIYSQAVESAQNGWPTSVRAVALEYPEDPTSWFLDRQFMVGSSILVAPVFSEDGEVTFYLPKGKWTSWWDDTVVEGPGWRTEKHAFNTMPIYIRERTILVLGQSKASDGEGFDHDWESAGGDIKLYYTQPGDTAMLFDARGQEIAKIVAADGGDLKLSRPLGGTWKTRSIGEQ
jgi:alpha-D-xyloside xylohydrolase